MNSDSLNRSIQDLFNNHLLTKCTESSHISFRVSSVFHPHYVFALLGFATSLGTSPILRGA